MWILIKLQKLIQFLKLVKTFTIYEVFVDVEHIRTKNKYTVFTFSAINCNDDVQATNRQSYQVVYYNNGKIFVQNKEEFLQKFKIKEIK